MNADYYEIRQCPACGLRYPAIADHPFGKRCPSCLGETQLVLRRTISSSNPRGDEPGVKSNFSILLDNIRSIWNVGSIFRTADGLGINKLYLCGITPTPENKTIRKTSLGAEETVTWEHSRNALETAKKLKADGHILIALEQDERAKSIEVVHEMSYEKITLIIGNEVTGVDPELLDLCDHVLYIPMRGQKRSFNVEVALAIAAYVLRSQIE